MKKFLSYLFIGIIFMGCNQNKIIDINKEIESKVDSLLPLLTLEEKINMIHASSSFTSGGVKRLGIPELVMSDGPHGVRQEYGRDWEKDGDVGDSSTFLPVLVALTATWNPELAYDHGEVLGNEAKHRGKDIILGPGINIHRTPLNGRNFEYMGEDPLLAGTMAVQYIKGVQDQGIAACVKHFAANNQEIDRFTINVEMDERALREIYLPAFKMATIQGNAYSIMGAYNKFRGQYCSHNHYLLDEILKDEWGYTGAVISDWDAVHDTKEALENGVDIEMGTDLSMKPVKDYNKFFLADPAIEIIKKGEVDSAVVDHKVRRILRLMYRVNKFGERTPGKFNVPNHQNKARAIADEAIVLLKNNGILPLDTEKIKKVAVIGANATRLMANRGGSAQVKAKYEITPLMGLQNLYGDKVEFEFVPGYEVKKNGKANNKLIGQAVKIARSADVVLYFGGLIHGYSDEWKDNAYDAEAADRPDMKLPFGQDKLIVALQKANKKTIVVLNSGGAIDINEWSDSSAAIIQAWYPGMEGGHAIADIIFGKVNPSGKLPISYPIRLKDSPAHIYGEYPGSGRNGNVHYNEGIYVGYRYFDTKNVEVKYPFGYGLSYTNFRFSQIEIIKEENIKVRFKVSNVGNRFGAEVAQLYVKDKESALDRPEKELQAFQKVFLEPGETKNIELSLDKEAFKYYNPELKKWVLEPGAFKILVGNSSRNILLENEIEL